MNAEFVESGPFTAFMAITSSRWWLAAALIAMEFQMLSMLTVHFHTAASVLLIVELVKYNLFMSYMKQEVAGGSTDCNEV